MAILKLRKSPDMEGAQGQTLKFRESNQIGLKLDSNRVHLSTLNYGSYFF